MHHARTPATDPLAPLGRRPLPLAAVALLLAAAALPACRPGYFAGGSMASRDLYTYHSTPDAPQSVAVKDIRTGEVLWTVDIPVGEQLVLRFYDDDSTGDPDRPSIMRWELMPMQTRFGDLDNAMPVPDRWSRRVDVSLRRETWTPQTPPAMAPAPEPSPAPAAGSPAPEPPPADEPPVELPDEG